MPRYANRPRTGVSAQSQSHTIPSPDRLTSIVRLHMEGGPSVSRSSAPRSTAPQSSDSSRVGALPLRPLSHRILSSARNSPDGIHRHSPIEPTRYSCPESAAFSRPSSAGALRPRVASSKWWVPPTRRETPRCPPGHGRADTQRREWRERRRKELACLQHSSPAERFVVRNAGRSAFCQMLDARQSPGCAEK